MQLVTVNCPNNAYHGRVAEVRSMFVTKDKTEVLVVVVDGGVTFGLLRKDAVNVE